jgi:hypothetical protein
MCSSKKQQHHRHSEVITIIIITAVIAIQTDLRWNKYTKWLVVMMWAVELTSSSIHVARDRHAETAENSVQHIK